MESSYSEIVMNLWIKTASISKHLDNSLGAIHGISLAEYMVLFNLMQAPNYSLRRIDIADALSRTGSGMTRMLLPMEKIGLIARDSSSRDARVSLVKITAKGKELYSDATATFNAKSSTLLRGIDANKADEFLDLLVSI